MRHPGRASMLALLCALQPAVWLRAGENSSPPEIATNDNRETAGKLANGVLEVQLELRSGRWHPEDAQGPYRDVYAFAEAGKAAQIPGPVIRAPQGTKIRVSITNRLGATAKVYGLHAHPGDAKEGMALAAGETREAEFNTGEPGTYLYWATTSGSDLEHRDGEEASLGGVLVVDGPGKPVDERIFVIGYWTNHLGTPQVVGFPWINGKSWPFTGRVTERAGETVNWRVVNASMEEHAMHLHGFYFDVDGVGDGEKFVHYAQEERPKMVTERVEAGHTFEMTWVPERAGNWLFHCHMMDHMNVQRSLHPRETEREHGGGSMANLGMGGLVIGVKVLPAEGKKETAAAGEATHKLELVLSENPDKIPFYTLAVNDLRMPEKAEKKAGPSLLGPAIVLTRGEMAEILVKNQTSSPSAIHWHGIEIENYYDGVAGWVTDGQKVMEPIAPGGTFLARMAPPRAGTFIYHTHWHDKKQIENGVYGPLIVLEPGQKYDPEHDRAILFSEGRFPALGELMLVNGGAEPDPVFLQSGTRYKFRLINITENEGDLRVRLLQNEKPLEWAVVARDGADLPAKQVTHGPADLVVTVGGTTDVEFVVSRKGNVDLQASSELFRAIIMQPFVFQ